MNFFETVKQTVTTRQAAERYGLSVNQSGMTRCPFHEDHNPSMKVDDRFYCFGCGASGDVIDFTARLFGISLKDATEKLAEDFGINSRPPTQSDIHTLHAEPPRDRERLCISRSMLIPSANQSAYRASLENSRVFPAPCGF